MEDKLAEGKINELQQIVTESIESGVERKEDGIKPSYETTSSLWLLQGERLP